MPSKQYIWFNGTFVPIDQLIFGIENRGYLYGDGLFETIHAFGTTARHINLHHNRLVKSMRLLDFDVPTGLTTEFLENEISRLLNKNRIFGSARIRLSVTRKSGGLYTPTGIGVDITIQASPLETNFYQINQKGLVVNLYTDLRKPTNFLSSIKSSNALLYILAGISAKKAEVDESILINDQNRLSESTSSNLFLIKGDSILTPPLNEGCINGIIRQVVVKIAPELGYKVIEDRPLEPELLLSADEVFLTNAISGIKWVVAFKNIRYFSKVGRSLCTALNRYTFPDQFKDGLIG